MDFTTNTGRSGLMVSLDFTAAFDSIDHQFFISALETFNLGDNFVEWIRILYNSSESCVLNSGQSTGWFPFQRGIRQGCPISPFLFVLAVEKMADVIRGNDNIEGIDLLDTHTKILQFADDSSLFLRNEASLLEALRIIVIFETLSGLGFNLQKSHGIVIGEIQLQDQLSHSISWGDGFKILGISFDRRDYEDKDFQLNFKPALSKMKHGITSWSLRNLSPKGKVVVLNTLILPMIYYQCVMLPVPTMVIREVENIISSFLRCNKKTKISRSCLEQSTASGGLGLHNIVNRVRAAKISWLKKLMLPPTQPWHFHSEFLLDQPVSEIALMRPLPRKATRDLPFLSDISRYWAQLYNSPPGSEDSARNESLWGNGFLRGKVKKKRETFCRRLNILRINDLLFYGRLMSESQFRQTYGCDPLPGLLQSVRETIPPSWLLGFSPVNRPTRTQSAYIRNLKNKWVDFQTLSTRVFYSLFQSSGTKV